jgi:hypothetical protein
MLGTWGGSSSDTWRASVAGMDLPPRDGGRTCSPTWIINTQGSGAGGGTFAGTYENTSGDASVCADSGVVEGTVTMSGEIHVRYHTRSGDDCALTAGSTEYQGLVSSVGVIAHREFSERCPDPTLGSIDYHVTGTLTVIRR